MLQSSTLSMGMEVHTDAMAVASVAQALHAEASYCGAIGTRSCDHDQPIRTMPSTSTPLVYVDEAGPCGEGLSCSRTKQGHACWVVAPSLIPHNALLGCWGLRLHRCPRRAAMLFSDPCKSRAARRKGCQA
jgi:hypothetical protein